MTEAKLKELQEINGCKNCLKQILDHVDTKDIEITIEVGHYDMSYATMHVQLHDKFFDEFVRFLRQQYSWYKEAFDNA